MPFTSDGSFSGSIHVLPIEVTNSCNEWEDIYTNIIKLKQSSIKEEHISRQFDSLDLNLHQYKNKEFYTVKFHVDKTGITRLSYIDIPGGEEKNYGHKYIVSRQCFYFLRDALHKHIHHELTVDSLTTIHDMPENKSDVGSLLIGDMRKCLVDLKRRFDCSDYISLCQARGIASYSKSLIESCHKKKYLLNSEYTHQKNYFDNISSSLLITSDIKEKARIRAVNLWNTARSLFLFYLSIIVPIIILFKEDIRDAIHEMSNTPEVSIVDITAMIFQSFYHMAGFLFSLVATFFLYIAFNKRYPEPALALKLYYNFFENIFDDVRKSRILAVIIIIMFLLILTYALASIYAN